MDPEGVAALVVPPVPSVVVEIVHYEDVEKVLNRIKFSKLQNKQKFRGMLKQLTNLKGVQRILIRNYLGFELRSKNEQGSYN